MQIVNYDLKTFLEQPQETIDEYMRILRFIEEVPTDQEVFHMKLKDVEFIKQELYGDIVEVIARVQRLPIRLVETMPITRFFGLYNSIKKQIETIRKGEENGLMSGEGDPRFEAVDGGKIMGKFGILNTLIPLAQQFGWSIEQIENMSYSLIFSILLYNKDVAKVQERMNKIKI